MQACLQQVLLNEAVHEDKLAYELALVSAAGNALPFPRHSDVCRGVGCFLWDSGISAKMVWTSYSTGRDLAQSMGPPSVCRLFIVADCDRLCAQLAFHTRLRIHRRVQRESRALHGSFARRVAVDPSPQLSARSYARDG